MEKRKKLTQYILYIVIVFSIFGLSYILTRNYITKEGTLILPLTGPEQQFQAMEWDINKVEEKNPWETNSKDIDITLPSNYILEKYVRDFIDSINTRDYDIFSNVVSKQFKWEFENNKIYYGENDGETIFIQGNVFGKDYFQNYSPILLDFQLPNNKKYYQIKFSENITLESKTHYYFIDNQKQEIYHIKPERNTFAKRAYFKINSDLLTESTVDGYVDFIFENGTWKIANYDWQSMYTKSIEVKDISVQNIGPHTFIHEVNMNDLINGISVKYGDIIKINNLSGIVFSKYEDNKNLWNSNKILNGSYEVYITESTATSFVFKNIEGVYFEGRINIIP